MTAVSAPGKVLLAGGYLVLDRAYTGLVLGLSARIHVLVRDALDDARIERSEIVVQSPQFRDASWAYSFRVAENEGGVAVLQLPGYELVAASYLYLSPVLRCCVVSCRVCRVAVAVPAARAYCSRRWSDIWSRGQYLPPFSLPQASRERRFPVL